MSDTVKYKVTVEKKVRAEIWVSAATGPAAMRKVEDMHEEDIDDCIEHDSYSKETTYKVIDAG